jgi:hypothetical protein
MAGRLMAGRLMAGLLMAGWARGLARSLSKCCHRLLEGVIPAARKTDCLVEWRVAVSY